MPSVTNLAIKVQSGTIDSYLATWSFEDPKITTNTGVKVGSLVTIKPGSTYYNGVSIPSFVMNDQWYVTEVYGNRVVLGKNKSGSYNICSAININSLNEGSGTEHVSDTLDHFAVKWTYDTGDQIWYVGSENDTTEKYSTYRIPENAVLVKIEVTPVSKTHTVNDKEVYYWTGTVSSLEQYPDRTPPEKVNTPTVTIDELKLTAKLENISDSKADKIEFVVYNGNSVYQRGIANVATARASFTCQLTPGGDYRVRARAINVVGSGQIYGAWSDYADSMATIPSVPSSILECRANSKTSIYLSWRPVSTATEYVISYTTERRYFDTTSQVREVSGIKLTNYELTGLEIGKEYFVRVAASNSSGRSGWSEIASVILGSKPAAPTTWASSTTVVTGEPLTLYWMHNSADNSKEVRAELELTVDGVISRITIRNTTPDDEQGTPGKYKINTSSYKEGTSIQWRVRTCGITEEYGDFSVQRTVDIYAKPALALTVTDSSGATLTTLTALPINVQADTSPSTQTPTGYYLTIYSKTKYDTRDNLGNVKTINIGDQVYSQYFDTKDPLRTQIDAGDVDLFDSAMYTIECVVSMNSGLTATSSVEFSVKWVSISYEPNAEISIDPKLYAAYIQPYCRNNNGALVENVTLAVYRKEFDGDFVKIADDLNNLQNVVVTDPHPALDFARYRIVSKDKSTGAIGYYDLPPYPVNGKAIVMQWDEQRIEFATSNPNQMVVQPWSGSMLVLPYNIEVSDSPSMEVEFVNYIGRSNPIAYYGTQKGYSSSWSTVIPKTDVDTLYSIRRLANWAGDVYVREPSGSGYWANVVVSYDHKFDSLTIPLSFTIKRVEGGV